MQAIEVREGSQVAEARRVAVALARAHGFGEEDAGRVAIVGSELATNLIKHGGGGELLVGAYEDRTGSGIELIALDKGPGIADVDASSRDGHSTAGSPGTGLGAIRRGSHASDIYTMPGHGTAILARLATGQPGKVVAMPDYGAVTLPMPGEVACGDAWCRHEHPNGLVLMVADGLGHGPSAAEASHAAVGSFHRSLGDAPSAALTLMHDALRPTRGAAVAIARIDWSERAILFGGVGNIAGTVVDADGGIQRMVSHNGTIGHNAKRIRDFRYALGSDPLVILASDGLATSWRLEEYPGLALRHPTLIAAVLYRDFTRGRDDVTVLVARGARP
ncbi:ATP-binding SpoIIE family protein phosphatase [Sphingomonas sp. 1P08PE]|uniref:ATP-binding SpoIIE family protein phosphatase n=1 Tax=Sphingomonas sp. 1P08PE TaxID=554122 RepID=UPI0039A0B8BD